MSERILVGLEHRGIDVELVATTAPREAVRLGEEAARSGADLVVAAGGDGTVHEVANGLLRALHDGVRGPVLGVLPVGTGNDFAKLVGPLKQLDRSMDVLVEGECRRYDACTAHWGDRSSWFINAAGTGIDVEVVRQMLRTRGRASPAVLKYLSALLRALVTFRALPLRLRLDDRVIERDAMIVVVGNGRCVGGGFWVTPDAEPDDGRFDICIVDEVSYLGALDALPRILRGKHRDHSKVSLCRAEEVTIEALGPDPLFFQLDGELHEPPDARTLTLRMHQGVLPVMADPAAP